MTGYASVHGTDHDDVIDTTAFGSRRDLIDAKDGNDTIMSGGGNDQVYAGSGKDLVYAGSSSDSVYGEAGDDTLYGGTGNDRMDGGNGRDSLFGEGGNDTLIGGQGEDYLVGGAGNDVLTGDGAGGASKQDIFFYDSNFGDDIITDFDLADDILEIKANINGTAITAPADLAPFVSEVSGNAVIAFGNGDSITLQGISKADLLNDIDSVIQIV